MSAMPAAVSTDLPPPPRARRVTDVPLAERPKPPIQVQPPIDRDLDAEAGLMQTVFLSTDDILASIGEACRDETISDTTFRRRVRSWMSFVDPKVLAAQRAARQAEIDAAMIRCGELELDNLRRLVRYQGREATMSRRPLQVLAALTAAGGNVVPAKLLGKSVWSDREWSPQLDNIVKVYIREVRVRLRTIGAEALLRTRVGQGYQIALSLEEPPPADQAESGVTLG